MPRRIIAGLGFRIVTVADRRTDEDTGLIACISARERDERTRSTATTTSHLPSTMLSLICTKSETEFARTVTCAQPI